MSWQADMISRYRKAQELGVNLNDVDAELSDNDGWFDEDTATTLMDCLLEHIQRLTH